MRAACRCPEGPRVCDTRDVTESTIETGQHALPARSGRWRGPVAGLLAFISSLLLVVTVTAAWTNTTALNTSKFVARVAPVIDDPAVQNGVATELSDQLISVLNVQGRVDKLLPGYLQFLGAPIAGQVDTLVHQQVAKAVASEQFRKVWVAALTLAHEQIVQSLKGHPSSVTIVNGQVYVNLVSVLSEVIKALPAQLPKIFATFAASHIPDSGALSTIISSLSTALGVNLPPTFGSVDVMSADQLQAARTGVKVFNISVFVIGLLSVLALVGALVISRSRRRTLVQEGLFVAGITALVVVAVRLVVHSFIAGITDPNLAPAAQAGVRILTSSLRVRAWWMFGIAAVVAVVGYLVGPGSGAVAIRKAVGGGSRWAVDGIKDVGAQAGDAVAVHEERRADLLRVAAAVIAGLLLLITQSWTVLIIIVVAYAVVYLLIPFLGLRSRQG